MARFELNFEEILQDKPWWLVRMLVYLVMVAVGFGLYAHYTREIDQNLAMIYIHRLQNFDLNTLDDPNQEVVFENLVRQFLFNPRVKDYIGNFYKTLEPMARKVLEDLTKFPEFRTELKKVQTKGMEELEKSMIQAETLRKVFVAIGAIGTFLFLVGLYFGVKL